MPLEIERRFLVNAALLNLSSPSYVEMEQGYLHTDPWLRVRVARPIHHPPFHPTAYITVKGRGTVSREEYEMEIPHDMGVALLGPCRDRLSKRRYRQVTHGEGSVWVIDVYQGALSGLVVAEVELTSEDQDFARPAWAIYEVTKDKRYSAAGLGAAQAIPLDYWEMTTLGREYVGMSERSATNLAELRGYRVVVEDRENYPFTVRVPEEGDVRLTILGGAVTKATVYPRAE